MIALPVVEATVLRTLVLAIALIVGGLPTGMVCNGPHGPIGSASFECGHAAHRSDARLVPGGDCSLSPLPIVVAREEGRRFDSQPPLGAVLVSIVPDALTSDSTHHAASLAARQHLCWRGSPLVLRI